MSINEESLTALVNNKDKKFNSSLKEIIRKDIENIIVKLPDLNIKGLTVGNITKHLDTYVEMVYLYIMDKRVWSIAYSGGKDSTVTMDICLKSLLLIQLMYGQEAINKTTYVLFSDTLLEMDPVIKGILKSMDEIEAFGNKYNLSLSVRRVSPVLKNTFFSLLIGKGYMVPRRDNRWCTDRMKIQPQKKEILSILNSNKDGFIAITGQRQDESIDRANRMQQLTVDGSFKKHEFKNCNLYAPIENWTSNDVWTHIYNHSLEWVDANTLGRVYAEASNDGGECTSLLEGFESGSTPGCGKSARYGCWNCTLFDFDKTLNNLTSHYDYMKHMEEFRNWLSTFRQAKWDHNRDVFIHGKHKMKKYDMDNHRNGMQIPGGYNLHFRKQILRRLMETERIVIEQRGEPLITDDELSYIQQCWIEDGDLEMSVKDIAYDREITIDPMYKKVIEAVQIVRGQSFYGKGNIYFTENWLVVDGLNRNVCSRYYCQAAIQLEKRDIPSKLILTALTVEDCDEKKIAIALIKTLPVETKMDFVDTAKENYIRKEWANDKIGFLTFIDKLEKKEIEEPQRHLFGFDGDYGTHFDSLEELENKKDITLCETISLEDKMRFFDEW